VIDIHTHLLPGVDDGSPNFEVSARVLQQFAADGVTQVVCTPHLEGSRAAEAPIGAHRALLDELRTHAPPSVAVSLGWEIMLDRPGCDLRAPMLALGDSGAVLVEFPRTHLPKGTTAELERIRDGGRTPVVAHPERYRGITLAIIREWRDIGVVIQTDATMLMAQGGMAEMAKTMLEEGLVDCLASDNHGDRRSLGAARRWLEEMGAEEHASLLTAVNAERVLRNAPVIPAPPLKLARGVFWRLRELVFGKK
jgi:protein-tyrosine phosphatase